MRPRTGSVLVPSVLVAALLAAPAVAAAQVREKAAAAEAALKDCDLETALRLWREVLAADPDHRRAKYVVGKLTAQALDLDGYLDVIDTLIEKGVTEGTGALLEAAGRRAATDAQKSRILHLRGRLACAAPSTRADGLALLESAFKLHPNTEWGAHSAIALARHWGETPESRRLLGAVIGNGKLPAAVREDARLALLTIESAGWTARRRIAALRELLEELRSPAVRRRALRQVVELTVDARGAWTPEAVQAAGAILAAEPTYDEAAQVLRQLAAVAAESQDPAALDAAATVLAAARPHGAGLAFAARAAHADALIGRAVPAEDEADVERLLADAAGRLDALADARPTPGEARRLWEIRGRLRLVRAQKLLALTRPAKALPAVMAAKDHYLAALSRDPAGCLDRLENIARLLAHVREWESALALYREIAAAHPHTPQARDALLAAARVQEDPLNDPMAALEAYAEYAARYPAELGYRQLDVGRRLRRLGYANVLDFQKRNGLNPDGIAGPKTRSRLRELEASFDAIRIRADGPATAPPPAVPRPRSRPPAPPDKAASAPAPRLAPAPWWTPPAPETPAQARSDVLLGRFVHPRIFRIARGLERDGRHHDAVKAYLLFLSLFPTKRQADDALLAVARIFRDDFLFEEAVGAYTEMMETFPKGNQTSEAYIEAAACLANLGRWAEARELYELYAKKFPKYKHVKLCRTRIKLMEEIQQYADFLDGNPESSKAPEAQYQIAVILYKKLGNLTKAAVEFSAVARRYPRHVRAADGLYTAGAAHLRTENFPAARNVFTRLVADYPDSRLADDAQYWIGHTHEYAARALGRLDEKRIVLKRRSGRARRRLLADVALRQRYHPDAKAGPPLPEDVWTADALGVLTSGSKRDRVNAELFRAIAAYRRVAEKFKMGDMAGEALHRIGVIYTKYLKDPEKGFQAYQELLANYPGTKKAVEALYEVGAYHLKRRKFARAVRAYRQFCHNYPDHARVEDAMLAVARCHMETKAYDKALDAYQSYLSKFPKGRHAAFARAQINWIRTYHY